MVQCKTCNKDHEGTFGSGVFCSRRCSNTRLVTEEQKQKVRETILALNEDKKEIISCGACGKEIIANKKRKQKYCNQSCANTAKSRDANRRATIDSIWKMSSRTRCKVLKRFGKGCCRCGWNEATCDLHHIHGRKIPNPHAASNLTLLCPNCHRLYHNKQIGPNDVISLDVYMGDWMKYYYG